MYPLKGTFDIESSNIQTCGSGIFFGRVAGSLISISGNAVADTLYGLDLENIESSMLDVSNNTISNIISANLIVFNPYYPGQAASTYAIHGNSFDVGRPDLPYADGIFLLDNDPSDNGSSLKVIDAAIVNNKVRAENCQYGLIHAIFTDGTLIAANDISGTSVPNFDYGPSSDPFGGIVIQGASHCSILGNHVANLAVTPDPAGAAIFLGPGFEGQPTSAWLQDRASLATSRT